MLRRTGAAGTWHLPLRIARSERRNIGSYFCSRIIIGLDLIQWRETRVHHLEGFSSFRVLLGGTTSHRELALIQPLFLVETFF